MLAALAFHRFELDFRQGDSPACDELFLICRLAVGLIAACAAPSDTTTVSAADSGAPATAADKAVLKTFTDTFDLPFGVSAVTVEVSAQKWY